MSEKKILILHGFMCNGKTSFINKLIETKLKDKDYIIIKDYSQYIANEFRYTLLNRNVLQEAILVSAINHFLLLFKTYIPNLKQEYVILDRDLYDYIAYTLMVYRNSSLKDDILKLLGKYVDKYRKLQDTYKVKHILLEDVIADPDECLQDKKRIEAITYLAMRRNIDEEKNVSLRNKLLPKYTEEYNQIIKTLIPDVIIKNLSK
jgi:hypothetical protein